MITEWDKALSVVLAGIALWINQKYGFTLPTDPNVLLGGIVLLAGLVFAVPNKPKGS